MSGFGAKWCVQRFEPPFGGNYGIDRESHRPEGYEKVCDSWHEACEAVTLAIGPNCLKFGVEADRPVVVFERDGAVIVVYLKLVF